MSQLLPERLLNMALCLELGGSVSGEDAARTIREALDEIETDAEIQRLRAMIANLKERLLSQSKRVKAAA